MLTGLHSIHPVAERRLGRFTVSRDSLDNWPEAQILFAQVVIVRCEFRHSTDRFEYEAYSPCFDVAPLGFVTPEYVAILTRETVKDSDGKPVASFVSVLRWEKVEPFDPRKPLHP